jgi:carbon monoxide dehydrogenase subunit G
MEFEKATLIRAPAERIWQMLFDVELMQACVPGTESVERVSDTQYVVQIRVKVSFLSARFKIRVTVVEARPPAYLRSEGAGEDSTFANSFKQSSEIFLVEKDEGTTELRMRVKMDIFGRLGSLGFNIIKTKVDRIWEEFGQNLAARVQAPAQ